MTFEVDGEKSVCVISNFAMSWTADVIFFSDVCLSGNLVGLCAIIEITYLISHVVHNAVIEELEDIGSDGDI